MIFVDIGICAAIIALYKSFQRAWKVPHPDIMIKLKLLAPKQKPEGWNRGRAMERYSISAEI